MTLMSLAEAFLLNPVVRVKKGENVPFVEMATLQPNVRDVRTDIFRQFSSGSKFHNGDVLMARITPSLENGKTSVYRSAAGWEDLPAAGSTEFIVVRGRPDVSTSEFAYYVVTSEAVRSHAIGSMNGSSGRQRVQFEALANFEIDLPPLTTQLQIVSKLSCLDDKIESNSRTRTLLRKLGLAYYRAAIGSDRAQVVPLGSLAQSISRGITPKYSDGPEAQLVLNQKCVRGGHISLENARRMQPRDVPSHKKAMPGDLLVNSTGVGTLGRVGIWHGKEAYVDSHLTVVRAEISMAPKLVLAYTLLGRERDIEALATGSTGQTELSPDRLASIDVAIPGVESLKSLECILGRIEAKSASLETESRSLRALRDALVPELISGRVKVGEFGQ